MKKGKNLVKSGFVVDVQDNGNDKNLFLRAHVQHSIKKDHPLSTKVVISKESGFIRSAKCTCVARCLGKCSHVAALLLYLNDHVNDHGYMVEMPKTSKECTWNKGKKRIKTPKPLHMASYRSKVKKTEENSINGIQGQTVTRVKLMTVEKNSSSRICKHTVLFLGQCRCGRLFCISNMKILSLIMKI